MNLCKHVFTFFLAIFWSAALIAAPNVTSVSPTNGSVSGGNVITIMGNGFNGATAVNIGERPAVSFTINSNHQITATVPAGTAGTEHVTVTKGTHTSSETASDYYTYTQTSWQGILSSTNQDTVTLFDSATNSISAIIPLPTDSLGSIITPNGKTIYAIDSENPSVYIIDAATNVITGTIPLPAIVGSGAFDIIVSPNGKKLYVSNLTSGYVTVIDVATNGIDANIFVTTNLGSLSITPDGKTVYVSNFNFTANTVTTIDTATNTIGVNISTGFAPGLTSITPDGTKGFTGNSLTDTVSVIDIATNTVTNNIVFPPGSGPYGSSILPNGQTIYVISIYNSTVTVIDVATETIITTIILTPGSNSFWAAATPDGKTVYVANETTGDVTPIDVATNTAGASFANVMGTLDDIEMSPDQAPVASFFTTGSTVGLPTTFDASASLSPIGTIANYFWDFGDGNTLSTALPIVNHIYSTAGAYAATLTVTNTAGTSTEKVFSSRFMSNNGGPTATSTQEIDISPLAPTHLKGVQKVCVYLNKKDYFNLLKWHPPLTGGMPTSYQVYRNANLNYAIGIVPGDGALIFEDHDRKKGKVYTYYVVSVSADGTISAPASVTVEPIN